MSLDYNDKKYFLDAVRLSQNGQSHSVLDRASNQNDIVVRCPICGDGKNKRSKRLHLYIKNGVTNVNCFNGGCPVENMTVWRFLKEFYPREFELYKKAKRRENLEEFLAKKNKAKSNKIDKSKEAIDNINLDFMNFKSSESFENLESFKLSPRILDFIESFEPGNLYEDHLYLKEFFKSLDSSEKEMFKRFLKS